MPEHTETIAARISPTVEAWTERTAGAAVVSPSLVQELLFDVYDEVKGDPRERLVTSWLTLTIERELFSATEIDELLRELLDEESATSSVG